METHTNTSINANVCVLLLLCRCEWRSWLKAATSLTVTERHFTHMLCTCRLQTFVTGASGGAWTWEDMEATLVPEVCSRRKGCSRGVQPMKGLQKGRVTPGCYVGRTQKRCASEGAAWLNIRQRRYCIKYIRRLRVGELAEPLCSNHDIPLRENAGLQRYLTAGGVLSNGQKWL
jgi:hypothetical protein